MEKIVLTYGTFDLFHIGHLNLSLSLGRMGEKLIVGLATDEFNAQRGKVTAVPFCRTHPDRREHPVCGYGDSHGAIGPEGGGHPAPQREPPRHGKR